MSVTKEFRKANGHLFKTIVEMEREVKWLSYDYDTAGTMAKSPAEKKKDYDDASLELAELKENLTEEQEVELRKFKKESGRVEKLENSVIPLTVIFGLIFCFVPFAMDPTSVTVIIPIAALFTGFVISTSVATMCRATLNRKWDIS